MVFFFFIFTKGSVTLLCAFCAYNCISLDWSFENFLLNICYQSFICWWVDGRVCFESGNDLEIWVFFPEIQIQLRDRVMFLGISFIVIILHVIAIIIIIIALYSKDNWITSIFNWMQNLQKYVPAVTENASKNLKKTSHVVYSFGSNLLHKQITFNYKKILHTVVKIICVQRSNL